MLTSTFTSLPAILPVILATPLSSRSYQLSDVCYSSETPKLNCYTKANGGTPQNITVGDIQSVATYLRNYGRETTPGRLFTMKAADTANCAEWSVFSAGTALALAKHINSTIDSSVTFEDIANTIDGGENATLTNNSGVISCLQDGGSLGVVINATEDAYNSLDYLAGTAVWDGIMIKIVRPA